MICLLAGATSTAKAHMIWHRKHQTFAQKMLYANMTIAHAKRSLRWSKANEHLIVQVAGYEFYKTLRRDHQWLLKYGLELKRKLTLEQLPPHYYGWLCIHNLEGSWTANTGNGYHGGLQMTYDWMKDIGGIHGGAENYTALQQMWAAERVSARFGFTWSWMHGQWPNSYPPCASYF